MLIELRRYSISVGHMDDMHARMQDLLLPLFDEHGVPAPLAIWESRDQTSVFTWMLNWRSFEHRQDSWARFYPSFHAARSVQSHEEFVVGADTNLVAPWSENEPSFPGADGTCELAWHVAPQVDHAGGFQAFCVETDFALLADAGASSVTAMSLMFGPMPRMLIVSSWPTPADRLAGLDRLGRMGVPEPIANAIGTGRSVLDHGLWERLDRAPYLESWSMGAESL